MPTAISSPALAAAERFMHRNRQNSQLTFPQNTKGALFSAPSYRNVQYCLILNSIKSLYHIAYGNWDIFAKLFSLPFQSLAEKTTSSPY
jgi:hypothetical protein